jgi:hypothetical protein
MILGDVDHGEQVAAHADHHGFHQIESGSRRYRCIDGVAALLQDLQADLCRQRLTGDNHAVLSHDLRTSLGGPALGTVTPKAPAERCFHIFVAGCHHGVNVGAGRSGGQRQRHHQQQQRDCAYAQPPRHQQHGRTSLGLHAAYYGAFATDEHRLPEPARTATAFFSTSMAFLNEHGLFNEHVLSQ